MINNELSVKTVLNLLEIFVRFLDFEGIGYLGRKTYA